LKQKHFYFLVAMDGLDELEQNITRAQNDVEQFKMLLSQARQQGRSQDTITNLLREVRDAQVELVEAMRAHRREMDRQNARMEFAISKMRKK
jgi:hypothetical protein